MRLLIILSMVCVPFLAKVNAVEVLRDVEITEYKNGELTHYSAAGAILGQLRRADIKHIRTGEVVEGEAGIQFVRISHEGADYLLHAFEVKIRRACVSGTRVADSGGRVRAGASGSNSGCQQ